MYWKSAKVSWKLIAALPQCPLEFCEYISPSACTLQDIWIIQSKQYRPHSNNSITGKWQVDRGQSFTSWSASLQRHFIYRFLLKVLLSSSKRLCRLPIEHIKIHLPTSLKPSLSTLERFLRYLRYNAKGLFTPNHCKRAIIAQHSTVTAARFRL